MKAETFKELFGEDEPIKNWETEEGMFDLPVRIIPEFLYQKMLIEIEKSQPIISGDIPSEIIDMATENAELRRGIGDIVISIIEAKKGNKNMSIKSDNYLVGWILQDIYKNTEIIKNHWVK